MLTLYMVQLGGRPKGRLIEQHDIFFGAASQVSDLIGDINEHWPEVKNRTARPLLALISNGNTL